MTPELRPVYREAAGGQRHSSRKRCQANIETAPYPVTAAAINP